MSVDAPDVETQAKELGWAPKDQWRGDPEKWIDAETFVRRGEEILPIVKANNRRLQEEVAALKNDLASTKTLLKASAEAIEGLKEFNSETNRERMKSQREALIGKLKEARQNDDVDAELAISQQLTKTDAALVDSTRKPISVDPVEPKVDRESNPDWIAFKAQNPWFGTETRKTTLAVAIAQELRADPANNSLTGAQFFARVSEEVSKTLGGNPRRNTPKVEGGGSGGDGGGGRPGHSYAELPPEAKQACDNGIKRFVGPGRGFKTEAEWRQHYVTKFFE